MEKWHFISFLVFCIFFPFSSWETYGMEELLIRRDTQRASPSLQEAAAKGVLQRLLPTHLSSFEFQIIPKDVCGGSHCFWIVNFEISSRNDPEILIKGTTAVEIVSGLHWYLKYWCGAHISWDKTGGIQLSSIPRAGSLPRVDEDKGLLIQRSVPWSYYQNVVTSSYSYVWWNWKRWEKEIDWMALQGINLPLAFTGQEAIWNKVFKMFNITEEDLQGFFGGPAFLAWARMGNLHGWGGPLLKNWLSQQLTLQKRILFRMKELGMTPVLPSFAGNVPEAFRKAFPSANITKLGNWNTIDGDPRWCCTYLLDPSDPLFIELGAAFIKQQKQEYGDVTHIYNCDTFNENSPPTSDPGYISQLGSSVYKAMSEGNKNAIWLMQGWLFSSDSGFWKPPQMKALLHSVSFGRMIVLDLFADVKPIWKRSSQFYGVPYIWCMLHNFGGNIEMYGLLDAIASGPIDARISRNSTMVGVGMCMEGIEQNPVVYELMSEMAFRKDKTVVEEWIQSYQSRRYGRASQQIGEVWRILYHTIYNCTDGIADHNRDFIVEFPDYDPSQDMYIEYHAYHKRELKRLDGRRFSFQQINSILPHPHLWYSAEEVIDALRIFLDAGHEFSGSFTYRYDLVDLTRQVLSKLANKVYLDAISAFKRKNSTDLAHHSTKFVKLIEDIDTLLGSNDNFLLGTWLESAKKLAANPCEASQYEWNARTQITMWFDNTKTNQSRLHDYANKYWNGLLKGYYLPRASLYFSYLSRSLRENETFNINLWREEWISFSNKWQEGKEFYPVKAKGDSITISKKLFKKYFG